VRTPSAVAVSSPRIPSPTESKTPTGIRARIASFTSMMQPSDLSEILTIGKPMVYKMCRNKTLPHRRIGDLIRFEPEAILEWYDRQ
jgi:excisionase family DNA binding protein